MNTSSRATPRFVQPICALVAMGAGLVLLGGWFLDVPSLRQFAPGWNAMAPFTALLLLLTSLASSQFERRPALANAALLISFSAAAFILANYLLGSPLDLNLLRRVPAPELPAPDTAAAFMLVPLALFCMRTTRSRAHDFGEVVAVLIVFVCMQVLVANLYQHAFAPDRTGFRQIAPHSTLAMLLLASTVVAHRPTFGIYRALSGNAASALLLRQLLPITVFACLLVGLLQAQAMRAGVGGTIPEIVAWSVTFTVIVLALLLFMTSMGMRRTEEAVRQHEAELTEATARAEAASHAKSRFMAVMSHELRTPLTAILGYAGLLDGGVGGELSPTARKYLDRIRSSGWHLVSLIDAVLLYASGRPAGENVRLERMDLGSLVDDLAYQFRPRAEEKGLSLSIDVPDARVLVLSERERLSQVLSSLLSNAVKFTDRGSIVVRVRPWQQHVNVDITDTGIGMDEHQLAHIWEPFEQLDDPHTRERGGIGLGMALTRLLCEQLGVATSVRSEPGAGTTVTLLLPAAPAEAPRELSLKGRHLLVVDDEPHVRSIMKRSLERYHAQVTGAAGPEEALRHLEAGHYDALVTDISMPGMTGIELAQLLAQQGSRLPVLFVTGAELSDEARAQIGTLGDRLIIKPFGVAELARAVATIFEPAA